MNQIGKNERSLLKYYEQCFPELSDEVKMKIDVVLNSEIEKLSYRNADVSLINRIIRICNQSETQCIEIICQIAKIVTDLRKFIREYEDVFPFIDKLLHDEEYLLKCISTNYKVFKFVKYRVSKQAQEGDFVLLLKCLNISGKVLKYILDSCYIFDSKRVIMRLLQASNMKSGKNSQKVFNMSIRKEIYGKLSYELKQDSDIILFAAEKGFPVLGQLFETKEYFPDQEKEKQKQDLMIKYRKLVIDAIRNGGLSLHRKSNVLQNDREIVMEVVKRDRSALYDASKYLRKDREFIFEMVTKYNASLYWIEEWHHDEELILSSIRNHPDTLKKLSSEMIVNRDFIFKCVKINGLCLKYAPPMYHSDIEIVSEAIKQNPLNFYCINATDSMKKECKISLLNALECRPTLNLYTPVLDKIDDLDVALKLIEKIPQSIHFLNEMIRKGCQDSTYKPTLLKNGYWMKYSEDAFQERINHAYFSAKIDSNSEINYYRNHFNNQMNLWKGLEWKKWD